MSALSRRPYDRASILSGLLLCALVNGALVGVVLIARAGAGARPQRETMTFVDAQLVRFGKPRDLSFLPHVKAQKMVAERKTLKLTDNPDRPSKDLPRPPDEEPAEKPLSEKAQLFKNLRDEEDDRATEEAMGEGSLSGSKGGTAAEASGDPYIREIMAAVTERWTVPTLITPAELSRLEAAACLRISDEGKLVEFHIVQKSGNDLFDGSLNTTLGSISDLPKPYGRFANAARRGKLCPVFTKQ